MYLQTHVYDRRPRPNRTVSDVRLYSKLTLNNFYPFKQPHLNFNISGLSIL